MPRVLPELVAALLHRHVLPRRERLGRDQVVDVLPRELLVAALLNGPLKHAVLLIPPQEHHRRAGLDAHDLRDVGDLVVLSPWQGIRIVAPSELQDLLLLDQQHALAFPLLHRLLGRRELDLLRAALEQEPLVIIQLLGPLIRLVLSRGPEVLIAVQLGLLPGPLLGLEPGGRL